MTASSTTHRVELVIGGMTCASCAARIEKKLNRLDGVSASVNYATEQAKISYPDAVAPEDLVATVRRTGYTAELPRLPQAGGPQAGGDADETHALRDRLVISTGLAVPVIAMAMVPPLQFTDWQWLSLTLAAPVAVWGAGPFHRAAGRNLRHGAATMDTLISTGVLAAFLWSCYALFFGTAGMAGMRHEFSLTIQPMAGEAQIYLEVAAGVTVFLLAGRYFEARSKRRAGAALRARLVENAQSGKAAVQRLADRTAAVFVPVVIALAVATLGFWIGSGWAGPPGWPTSGRCPCPAHWRRRPGMRSVAATRSSRSPGTARCAGCSRWRTP